MGLAGLKIVAGDEVTLAPKLLITCETGSDPSYRVVFSASRHALSFEAKWSIPDRAAELYKDYVLAGLTDDDLVVSPRY